MSFISIRNVSHIFVDHEERANWALKDIDLALDKGRFTCVLGPSGCGKTTLLHLMAGFMRPTYGEVEIAGRQVVAPGPDRGVVFQEYALFAWMTVRQNIEFGLKVKGLSRAERHERAQQLLELIGLPHAGSRYPHELSGGMRQRVAVARALAPRPELLLMDEPFAAVDAMTRATLQSELLRIWCELGLSIVFITHNIDEAVFLAEEVVVMSAHPGSISSRHTVDLPHPRDRGSKEFAAWFSRIHEALNLNDAAAA
jgi:NitT/TauT family transport system ATP-binding protein